MNRIIHTSPWSPAMVSAIRAEDTRLPHLPAATLHPVLAALDLWDMWPVADADGRTFVRDGRQWWFFLAVSRGSDPESRHDHARIHLVSRTTDGWHDHGPVFANGFAPGSREWSGSALLAPDETTLTMFFTAAGDRGRGAHFRQRLFQTTGQLSIAGGNGYCADWSAPEEIVAADDTIYAKADQAAPVGGSILGFRDPGYFRDPRDGAQYLTFTGNPARSVDPVHGLIGLASLDDGGWRLLPPLIDARGTNSELERPHIVMHGDTYYLFWSTQRRRFAQNSSAPTGLYAMAAEQIAGPWRPVNGTGLVAGNPDTAPYQAYCWWVTGEGEVLSFVDYHGPDDPQATGLAERRARFGGTPAPFFSLRFAGDRVTIA